jgi:hypothetical protein
VVTRHLPVSFERTPPLEITAKAEALTAAGWMWIENRPPRWVARMRKDFPDDAAAERAEDEIAQIMGKRYLPIKEISATGSSKFVSEDD